MWIKLGNDYLNLDHVIRVHFNIGWKNGNEELVAEVEGLVKGDVQIFTRYRNHDAEVLQAIFGQWALTAGGMPAHAVADAQLATAVAAASTKNTVPDF